MRDNFNSIFYSEIKATLSGRPEMESVVKEEARCCQHSYNLFVIIKTEREIINTANFLANYCLIPTPV